MAKISKNFKTAGTVNNYMDLYNYKSVYVKRWNRISPTSFIIGMQFRLVIRWMQQGQFMRIKRIEK